MVTIPGNLVNLKVSQTQREDALERARQLRQIRLTHRQLCDLELLSVGGFSPLDRFMSESDYRSVLDSMRLADGTVFPIPVTLSVPTTLADTLQNGDAVALTDQRNNIVAIMRIDGMYTWSKADFAQNVLDTQDQKHPLIVEMDSWGDVNLTGDIEVIDLPTHYDFASLRHTPAELQAMFAADSHERVVAFQTRNPMHRAHEELTRRAMQHHDAALLIHPVVGMTKPGDVDYYTRVRSYKALLDNYFDSRTAYLSLLPLAMRMAGPREALWHAIIRRNYGATHFIVGRDHAGPGNDSQGVPFYDPYASQELVQAYQDEIGITMVPFEMVAYLPDTDEFVEESDVQPGQKTLSLSGTQIREDYLAQGRPLPEWFTRPEVASILRDAYPPRTSQGFCLWFTGLSASGKSTTAEQLVARLAEYGRPVTLLDGDIVRTHLSKGLTFSQEDRDANILRIGFVAAEIVRHNGIVVCAAISPYTETRNRVREMIGENFFEIFVDTPLAVCEDRDPKGLYQKARQGELRNFTGISDPYEAPQSADITLDTVSSSVRSNVDHIVKVLIEDGYLARNG